MLESVKVGVFPRKRALQVVEQNQHVDELGVVELEVTSVGLIGRIFAKDSKQEERSEECTNELHRP
jgi:hypothetical protein